MLRQLLRIRKEEGHVYMTFTTSNAVIEWKKKSGQIEPGYVILPKGYHELKSII